VGEADTAHEVFKAWVRPERIEARSDEDAGIEPLLVTSFEPTHGLIRVTERRVDCGNLRSQRLARARALLQIVQ